MQLQPQSQKMWLTSYLSCNNFGNPSSIHSFGRESRSLIEGVRKSIADELNVKSEIIPLVVLNQIT